MFLFAEQRHRLTRLHLKVVGLPVSSLYLSSSSRRSPFFDLATGVKRPHRSYVRHPLEYKRKRLSESFKHDMHSERNHDYTDTNLRHPVDRPGSSYSQAFTVVSEACLEQLETTGTLQATDWHTRQRS